MMQADANSMIAFGFLAIFARKLGCFFCLLTSSPVFSSMGTAKCSVGAAILMEFS